MNTHSNAVMCTTCSFSPVSFLHIEVGPITQTV